MSKNLSVTVNWSDKAENEDEEDAKDDWVENDDEGGNGILEGRTKGWLRAWWMTSCLASAFLFMKPSTVVSSVSVAMTVSLTISATAVVVRFLLLFRHAWHVLDTMLLLPRCEWNEWGGRFRRHLQHVLNVRHQSHNCVGDDAPQFVHLFNKIYRCYYYDYCYDYYYDNEAVLKPWLNSFVLIFSLIHLSTLLHLSNNLLKLLA